MISGAEPAARLETRSLHRLGVASGFAAGAWLGAAEAPTKLVSVGLSPFVISLGMVAGVFVARWTVPMLLKGTRSILLDLRQRAHLLIWAVLAGMLWAVANTLTVFAIRDIGLSIAFPLWNTNSLFGLFWGWLLFGEMRGSTANQWLKVLGGAAAMAAGACLLAYATSRQATASHHTATMGFLAALTAGLLWGTMYISYRKAYISGMNPLSFVTVFTFGELGATAALAVSFDGGVRHVIADLATARPALFWLFLGGFCWVIGDLFQQYAAKYLGIGRGIPLSNTNQLWGLAWGALVFRELDGQGLAVQSLVIAGSLVIIAGAIALSFAEPSESEQAFWKRAVEREHRRYRLPAEGAGLVHHAASRRWWEALVVAAAVAMFVWLGLQARRPPLTVNVFWMSLLIAATVAWLVTGGCLLWKRTRFS
jgi:drug/metabolite transporter (DMT)-like permease